MNRIHRRSRSAPPSLLDVNREAGEALRQELGPGASFHACDVSDEAAVERVAAGIEQEGPPVRVLFTSAGLIANAETVLDMDMAAHDRVWRVNYLGTVHACRSFGRRMAARRQGMTQAVGKRWGGEARAGQWRSGQPYRNVMSIITTWVDNGSPYVVPSAMSKAGIDVMTKSLAVEWAGFGVRLNAVGPGEIPTEGMSKRLNPGEEPGARSKANNPMGRTGRMGELQNLAAFLMAPGNATGSPARAS